MPICTRQRTLHTCGHPIDPGYPRACRQCRNAGMRIHRLLHEPTDEQRRRANARSYAHVYLRRGKLTRKPCEHCGSTDSQMHHRDYSKPLEVIWLCRPCRLLLPASI